MRVLFRSATPEELVEMRERQRAEGRPVRYDGRWRDRDPSEAPKGVAPVIRFKAPQIGETAIDDKVQGRVTVRNEQPDAMVLLRGAGTPTYHDRQAVWWGKRVAEGRN